MSAAFASTCARAGLLALFCLVMACGSPAKPNTGCALDNQCATGQKCIQQICVTVSDLACNVDADCVKFADKLPKPPGSADECLQPTCENNSCKQAPRATGTVCTHDDDKDCTLGACDAAGVCKSSDNVKEKQCYIKVEGKCVTENTRDGGLCRSCQPSVSPHEYTVLPATATCADDDDKCTDDLCDGLGACKNHPIKKDSCRFGTNDCVAGGSVQPGSDGCTTCDPIADPKAWSKHPGNACTDADICHPGVCSSAGLCDATALKTGTCFLAATGQAALACFEDGVQDPGNGCRTCAADKPSEWTDLPATATCDSDSVGCTIDLCDGAGTCAHTADDGACKSLATQCQGGKCDVAKDCVPVPMADDVSCTGPDGIACTVEFCDNKGGCDAAKTVFEKSLCDDGVPCTIDACAVGGCTHAPDDGGCDDKNDCTVDQCDASAGCKHSPVAAGNDCLDDGLACTDNKCDGAGACKTAIKAGSCVVDAVCHLAGKLTAPDCQACDPTVSAESWSPVASGAKCVDEGLACTEDACNGKGACTHAIAAGQCLIEGVCVAPTDNSKNGGCMKCVPGKSQKAWTNLADGTECTDEGVGCTVDKCDGAGTCKHTPDDEPCMVGVPACKTKKCVPGDPLSDVASGCFNVDSCAWGHFCDAAANSCVTAGPLTLVSADAVKWPAPTNPAVGRHVLDAKQGLNRTWVVFQDGPAVSLVSGGWQVTGKSGLHALALDDVVAPAADKTADTTKYKPVVLTLPPATALAGNSALVQAFPVLTVDPSVPGQVWLGWLEGLSAGADPASLTATGVGGYVRVARLDGTDLTGKNVWDAVAGEKATKSGTNSPLFATMGFAPIDDAGAPLTDPGLKKFISIRGYGASFAEWVAAIAYKAAGIADTSVATTNALAGNFSTVHPVVVDLGSKATGARYFGLAFTEKAATTRFLWAQPIVASGEAVDDPANWLSSDVLPSPGKPGGLDGVTAVCSLDAAADANGAVGVAMVVRRGTKNQVLFAKFVGGVLQGSVSTVYEVTFNDGANVCQIGLVGARIANIDNTFALTFSDKQSAVGSPAPLYYWSSASGKPPSKCDYDVWTTDTAFGGQYATLANRGLVPAMALSASRWQLFGEGSEGGKRAIVVQTVVAPTGSPQ